MWNVAIYSLYADIESLSIDGVGVVNTLSQSFEEDDTGSIIIDCQPEELLAAKSVHIRFLNLASQLQHMLKYYDPQHFLELCNKFTVTDGHLKTIPLIPSEYLEGLDNADTGEIFNKLAFLWSWNNHSLLRALLEACDCHDGVKLLDDFESQIDTNQPMELFPIPPPSMKMAPSSSSAYTVLSIRSGQYQDEQVPLQYVIEVATMMVEKFKISLHALQLLAARPNPLMLYWMILKSIVPLIHTGVNEHLGYLKECKFTEIVIYPSTILFSTDNLGLGPFTMLSNETQLGVGVSTCTHPYCA